MDSPLSYERLLELALYARLTLSLEGGVLSPAPVLATLIAALPGSLSSVLLAVLAPAVDIRVIVRQRLVAQRRMDLAGQLRWNVREAAGAGAMCAE